MLFSGILTEIRTCSLNVSGKRDDTSLNTSTILLQYFTLSESFPDFFSFAKQRIAFSYQSHDFTAELQWCFSGQ